MIFTKHRYSLLNAESKHESSSHASLNYFRKHAHSLYLITACFCAGIVGYFATRLLFHNYSSQQDLGYLPLNTIPITFKYDRNFSDKPSNDTDAAWRSIFPEEGGFFTHPIIDSARSTFSVYHQLHCLDGLRYGYHMNREAALQGKQLPDENVPWDLKPHHMRHCIDLLRQALMCNADTTIETVDDSVHGVHGFRTEHQCKDWRQLREWTTEQQKRKPTRVES